MRLRCPAMIGAFGLLSPLHRIVMETLREFQDDDCTRMAAALSFYTVLSLPPLLVLLFTLSETVLEPAQVQRLLTAYFGEFAGPAGTRQVETILENAEGPGKGGPLGTLLGLGGLLFGATGAFAQLQTSLNRAWEIAPDPTQGGVRNFFAKRLTSFLLVLGIGGLLVASVAVSATLAMLSELTLERLPGGLSITALRVLNTLVSLGIITLLFSALFRVLPDAVIHWRDVGVGAAVTALLFVLGKTGFGIYLGQSDPGSAYGAAGSLAVLLLWVYLSSMILLLGAEFTQVWARHHGIQIVPEAGAVCLRGERSSAPGVPGWHTRLRSWKSRG